MNKPHIEWYARIDDDPYQNETEIYAGTFTTEDKITVDMQVWNNRYGLEEVESIKNFSVNFYFDNLEDSSLLQYCKLIYNNQDELPLTIKGNKATATFPSSVTLSGEPNDGSASYKENYIALTFEFQPPNSSYKLKENDLKNLYFEVVSFST